MVPYWMIEQPIIDCVARMFSSSSMCICVSAGRLVSAALSRVTDICVTLLVVFRTHAPQKNKTWDHQVSRMR